MAYKILLVDDSATTRAMIRRTIKMAQVPTDALFEAADGKQALAVLAANHVDLVFADLNMPEMNGIDLTKSIRNTPATADIPVVIVSSESMEAKIALLRHYGARGYIKKPFTPEQIRAVITDILGVVNA